MGRLNTSFYRKTAILGCVVLSLAFGRCSPIAPSVLKSSLRGGKGANTASQAEIPQTQMSAKPVSVFVYKSNVIGVDDEDSIAQSEMQHVVTLSEDSLASQLSEFKRTGETQIQLEGIPSEGSGYFEIAAPSSTMDIYEVKKRFDTVLKPSSGNTWTLKISDSTPRDVSQWVRDSLVSVTLTVSCSQEAGSPCVGQ